MKIHFQRLSLSSKAMARSSLPLYYFSPRRVSSPSSKSFFFVPATLALISTIFILFYIFTTSTLFTSHHHRHTLYLKQPLGSFPSSPLTQNVPSFSLHNNGFKNGTFDLPKRPPLKAVGGGEDATMSQVTSRPHFGSEGNFVNNLEVFHDGDIFLEDYKEMNNSFKIYVYPVKRNDPFAHALLPVDFEPGGNYASESYFKKALMKSHFITKDPTKADLFFLPFSIARLRHDRRIGTGGIQDFIRDYIFNISQKYPYWNRSGGADHFYVACHSIGRSVMAKARELKLNAIQIVCSSSYFLSGYIAHKDASLPQVWPRTGDPPNLASSKRNKLSFFAGSINSPVREKLLKFWRNDSEIAAHYGRLKTPYADELLSSKFCLHVKGFEVNTARIADSLYYGCVPIIIANYYDLPFADILNWKSFSIVVVTVDIPSLKQILRGITSDEYLSLQRNVLKVRKHFQWHVPPIDFDAFYMVMYELWLRRSSARINFSLDPKKLCK
ncbi:Exostosin family protein isoform 2 [Theobroma cacao]|uniref:Exostosin family protein isoform 2 n=2 Tax=Theobroma cacao TaxID=3641 RepID=A0A061F0X9_THECC|nr:Exostosin family protein isoform 2 [Theobroma cacao]